MGKFWNYVYNVAYEKFACRSKLRKLTSGLASSDTERTEIL